jgi:hypothetical protein
MQRSWLRDQVWRLVFLGGLAPSVLGCGGVNKPAGGGDADAAVDSAAAADAPVAAPRCDPTKPFGPPTVVPNINGPGKDVTAVLADDLTIYWASDRAGSSDLYVATRTSRASSFTNPTALTAINGAGAESAPALTRSGLTLYYAVAPVGDPNADIYVATRPDVGSMFSSGTPVAKLNGTSDDGDVSVTGDGGLVYFASSRPGTGGYDIYVAVHKPDGSFDVPRLVSELDTAAYDAHPRITADGLTMYYSSMRTDGGAQAGADIWTASRSTTAEPFGSPKRVPELSTPSNESPTWIAPDGCSIYLQTDRSGGPGGQDIWEAVKPL